MKYLFDDVFKMFDERGYELLETEYVNVTTPMRYRCKKHNNRPVQTMPLKELMQGRECDYCKIEQGKQLGRPWPEDIVKEMVEDLNCEYVGRYADEKNNSRIRFICNIHRDYGIQESAWTPIKKKMRICSVCNGNCRDADELQRIIDEKKMNIDIIGEYKGARERIKCRCRVDGYEWEPLVYNLLSGYGCPICGNTKSGVSRRIPPNIKLDRLQNTRDDIEFLSTPVMNTDKVKCRCKKCGYEWEASYYNLVKPNKPTGCPNCNLSKGEKKVKEYLEDNNIKYEFQKTFPDLVYVRQLRFDFYLPDYNILIEYDGETHYSPMKIGGITQIEADRILELNKIRDDMKNDYCKKNNYCLVRIPFTKYNSISSIIKYAINKCKDNK